MAFGKDRQVMRAVGSFRQISAQASTNKRGERKSKGGVPYFVDMYVPSTDEIDLIRLVQGAYLQDQIVGEGDDMHVVQVEMPFIKFTEHFDGANKTGVLCSAGVFAGFKDKREPCHGCNIYWETAARNNENRFESSRISRQDKYAFSVFDYGTYHKMDQYDRDTGKPRIDPKTKLPYFNWTKCLGQGCDACRANAESKVGNMSHWPINYTQLQVLRNAETNIGKGCVTCGGENCIVSLGWMCDPKTGGCGECAIDMATTTLKKDEMLTITDNTYTCPACKHAGLLEDVYQCNVCAPRGHEGVRASLFDVDLRVQAIPNPSGKGKNLQVVGWSAPHPVAANFAADIKPVDLPGRYAPTPLDIQASKLGVKDAPPAPVRTPHTGPAPTGQVSPPPTTAPAARSYASPYANKQ